MRAVALLALAGLCHGAEPVVCPDKTSLCPAENTCCPLSAGGYGCVSDEFPGGGVCCGGDTACAHGYKCGKGQCDAVDPSAHPLAKTTPRYALCRGLLKRNPHVLPVPGGDKGLLYYSTVGDLSSPDRSHTDEIRQGVVIVHGANRNADDYFCVGTVLSTLFGLDPKTVAVVAPRFAFPEDDPPSGVMVWNGSDKDGAWRYGAQALPPSTVSSFDAMDTLLARFMAVFPRLEHVSIIGHSSGGQFVQRFTLTSSSTMFSGNHPRMSVIVANPSSFAYLDSRRWVDGKFRTPKTTCPDYNDWQFGLAPGSPTPYFEKALKSLGAEGLGKRYANRPVTYLAGGQDVCNVTKGWCESHGLEVTCADELQGEMRLERGKNFFKSLRQVFNTTVHSMVTVPGVGHDHALMFESMEGLRSIFG